MPGKQRLDAAVRAQFEVSWSKARGWIDTGKIQIDGVTKTDQGFPVESGHKIELNMNAPRPSTRRAAVSPIPAEDILLLDTQVIVLNKPSGVSTVPFREGESRDPESDTLEHRICAHLKQPRVVVVHRLDRETSGLILFARNREAGRMLAQQFRFHTVSRRYLALAHGEVRSQTIQSLLVDNRGDGLRGSLPSGSSISRDVAKPATTHVRALKHFNGMTLIECRLETGRTHQIRIHLSEAGHPLLGEKAYIREFRGPPIKAARLMLHATELGFNHPTRDERLMFELPPPADFQELL